MVKSLPRYNIQVKLLENMDKYYLSTTTPYVNSDPHIGFALEIIHADIIARYHKLLGKEVVFNTGTDEHGLKIYKKAQETGVSPKEYADQFVPKFEKLKSLLNLSYTNFIRTTDPHHYKAAQEFWNRCLENDDIYKKAYQVKYCVGCELEKTDSELIDGKCPIHPNLEIEIIEEENYFFKFSKYQQSLLDLYKKNPHLVVPQFRFHEIIKFVESGLQDFSISRLKEKMPWGVPVPNDDKQVMYVWFDALVNYISTLGWPENEENFKNFWGTIENPKFVQFAGKDNLRQQSAMWQAMLMSAKLPASKHIVIHGFITSGGQKMSKSLGNVVDPFEVVEKYGADALRFWLAHDMSTFEDGDFTFQNFEESYTANLVNGIGNLVSRVLTMAKNYEVSISFKQIDFPVSEHLVAFEIQKAIGDVMDIIRGLDKFISETEPFKTIKTDPEKAKADVAFLVKELSVIATRLAPFLPETSEKIKLALETKGENIPHLFPRLKS